MISNCGCSCGCPRIIQGPQGLRGPQGPQGPPGISPAPVYAFAGLTGLPAFNVMSTGTNIPLPQYQILSPGITVDASNTVFTILIPGVYRIVYHVNLEQPSAFATRLTLNGVQVDASELNPALLTNSFSAEVFLQLNTMDTLSLQLFKNNGIATFQLGIGATLSIVKESLS